MIRKLKKQWLFKWMNEWQKIMQQLEMLDDIEAYDKAKKTNSAVIAFSQAVKEIKNH